MPVLGDQNHTVEAVEWEHLFAVPVGTLYAGTVPSFDIYFQPHADIAPVLYREGAISIDEEDLNRLRDRGHERVFIRRDQFAEYRAYIEQVLVSIAQDPNIPVRERAETLYRAAAGLVAEAVKDPFKEGVIERCRSVSEHTLIFALEQPSAFFSLVELLSNDYTLYTHSVNVMLFGAALAGRLKLGDDKDLRDFAVGALLHDIGKTQVSGEVLEKKGPLSPEEWRVVRQHPTMGRRILSHEGRLQPLSLDIVMHHHERLDGKGYPDNLTGGAVTPWARAVAIADVFDALTTRRPYRAALSSFDALRLMQTEMDDGLDMSFFREFVKMLCKRD
jgi:putative nucleotidyltransferase with HDIG domain